MSDGKPGIKSKGRICRFAGEDPGACSFVSSDLPGPDYLSAAGSSIHQLEYISDIGTVFIRHTLAYSPYAEVEVILRR